MQRTIMADIMAFLPSAKSALIGTIAWLIVGNIAGPESPSRYEQIATAVHNNTIATQQQAERLEYFRMLVVSWKHEVLGYHDDIHHFEGALSYVFCCVLMLICTTLACAHYCNKFGRKLRKLKPGQDVDMRAMEAMVESTFTHYARVESRLRHFATATHVNNISAKTAKGLRRIKAVHRQSLRFKSRTGRRLERLESADGRERALLVVNAMRARIEHLEEEQRALQSVVEQLGRRINKEDVG
ncbi:MAG: hypothetical protein Q9162_002702 [Coniocarpon cinnabarinum]